MAPVIDASGPGSAANPTNTNQATLGADEDQVHGVSRSVIVDGVGYTNLQLVNPAGGAGVQGQAAGGGTVVAYGTVTNPAAGTTLATSGTLAAGAYRCKVMVGFSGTLGGNDLDNIQLVAGGSPVGRVLQSAAVDTGAALKWIEFERVVLASSGTIQLQNILVAGNAAAIYRVVLHVTPLL